MRNTEGEGDLMLLRVREFRQRARLSQAALATQSHCSRELISAIENDRQPECNIYEARVTIEMISAVFESHRQNAPVTFPLKTRENPLSLL